MNLADFDSKWRPLAPDNMRGFDTHYLVWCLLYTDKNGMSPFLTQEKLQEMCMDYTHRHSSPVWFSAESGNSD